MGWRSGRESWSPTLFRKKCLRFSFYFQYMGGLPVEVSVDHGCVVPLETRGSYLLCRCWEPNQPSLARETTAELPSPRLGRALSLSLVAHQLAFRLAGK